MTFSIDEALAHAQRLSDRGETGRARALYQTILERHPDSAEAREAFLELLRRSSLLGDLSGLVEKGAFSALVERGEVLAGQFPNSVILHNLLGIAHANLGQHGAAIRHFSMALSVRPDMAEIHANLGKALGSEGRKEEAVASFRHALKLRPDYADAHFSLGVVLSSMARQEEAADHFFQALRLRPNFAEAEINLGSALRELGRFDEAVDCFHRALKLASGRADTHIHLATTYNLMKRYPQAIAALEDALKIAPDRSDARALRLFLASVICDWDMVEREAAAISGLGLSGKAVQPFMLLALDDDPARNRIRAERLAQERYALPELETILRSPAPRARLRLGYFSADFHDHAVLFQLIRVLELHDRTGFEVFAYSYGPAAQDGMRARAIKAVDVFRDVRTLNGKEIAEAARRDGIDIAIDLMGYTRNGRPEIFANRAAPVQISYLGYPGTQGAAFMDYLIADRIIIPEALRAHYAEKIIFMPHAHMATDNSRAMADHSMTRRAMGLPETGFVFCCFNNSFKFSPAEFDIWMSLLRRVEGSVLWFAGVNEPAQGNLAQQAARRDIEPGRLIFSPRVDLAQHLARYCLADLFLDNFHYTGHATAADALWAGLPLVTLPGRGFQARVAASLLTAMEIPELIAETAQDYERLAWELASNPDRLAALKRRLHENKTRAPLFDTEGFTKSLETGYRQAYQRWLNGDAPGDILLRDADTAGGID